MECRKGQVADYDSMVFKSDDSEIYGQILKPDRSFGDNRPCVMIFHGFAGFARFDDIGQALCRAGYVVVIPHHRGAWGSQGKYTISNCVQDAVNLVRYAQSAEFQEKYHTNPGAIFLIGHSMGGNTVLNAAGKCNVRGIILLDPCDIGTMTQTMNQEEMLAFLVDNGLNILKTSGSEAVYQDLAGHAEEYAFPNAAARLNQTAVLLIDAKWGLDESGNLMKNFYAAIQQNPAVPFCAYNTYPCNHGMMGARVRITRDIADFIKTAAREKNEKRSR